MKTAALSLLVFMLFVGIAGCNRARWTPQTVETFVSQEILPGTSRAEVVRLLRVRGIEFAESDAEVNAVFRNPAPGMSSVKRDFRVSFQFDGNSKLVSHRTQELLTGP